MILGEDDIKTLSEIVIYGQSRPVKWEVKNPLEDSQLFKYFTPELVEKVASRNLSLHAHTYSVSFETFS